MKTRKITIFFNKDLNRLNTNYDNTSSYKKQEENQNNLSYNNLKNKTNIVENILYKMGWKGKGLGKYEQGILKPLITKVLNKKGESEIINENPHYELDKYFSNTNIIDDKNLLKKDNIELSLNNDN